MTTDLPSSYASAATPLATNPIPPDLRQQSVSSSLSPGRPGHDGEGGGGGGDKSSDATTAGDDRSARSSIASSGSSARHRGLIGTDAPRLRSAARYGPFRPVALACCTGLPTPLGASDDADGDGGDRDGQGGGGGGGVGGGRGPSHRGGVRSEHVSSRGGSGGGGRTTRTPTWSTTAAMAGPHGVAIFQTSKPHVPTIVLNHASPASSPIRSLAFQPCSAESYGGGGAQPTTATRSSLLLAAARGTGVLVWDASGRSLSPLLGRLGSSGLVYGDSSSGGGAGASVDSTSKALQPPPSQLGSVNPMAPSGGGPLGLDRATTTATTSSASVASPRTAIPPGASLASLGRSHSISHNSRYDQVNTITSLCWTGPSSGCGGPSPRPHAGLVTTTHSTVSIWDLRCWSSRMRPTVRFSAPGGAHSAFGGVDAGGGLASSPGISSYGNDPSASSSAGGYGGFVSVACDPTTHRFAALDSSGLVRVYDERGGSGGSGSGGGAGGGLERHNQAGPLATFWAHDAAGVGISYVPSGWLTWGIDSDNNSMMMDGLVVGGATAGRVKLWRDANASGGATSSIKTASPTPLDDDSYWYMDPTACSPGTTSRLLAGQQQQQQHQQQQQQAAAAPAYKLQAQFGPTSVADLCCARVCPYPFVDCVITVGQLTVPDNAGGGEGRGGGGGTTTWQADLWALRDEPRDSKGEGSAGRAGPAAAVGDQRRSQSGTAVFGADLITTLRGDDDGPILRQMMMGGSYDGGHLVAAELAVGRPLGGGGGERVKSGDGFDDDCELLLCCLSSTGYLTTHAVPEASLHSCRSPPRAAATHGRAPPLSPTKAPNYRVVSSSDGGGGGGIGVTPAGTEVRLFRPTSDPSLRRHLDRDGADTTTGTVGADNRTGTTRFKTPSGYGAERQVSDLSADDPRFGVGGFVSGPQLGPTNLIEGGHDGGTAAAAALPTVVDPISQISRGVDGALMQFDMDESVPIALPGEAGGEAPVPPGIGPSSKSPGGADVVGNRPATDGELDAAAEGQQTASRTVSIDPFRAMNVPCPRPCGASFGRGGGGIVAFHNGEVRKLWSWFQSDQDGGVGAGAGQQTPQGESVEVDLVRGVYDSSGGGGKNKQQTTPASTRAVQQSPRTMLDLMRMNAAAKIAQWGVDDAEGGGGATDKNSSSDDDSDGIDSDDSSNSSDDDDFHDSSNSSDDDDFHEAFFALQQQSTAIHDDRRGSRDAHEPHFPDALSRPVSSSSPPSQATPFQRRPYSGRKRSVSMEPRPDAAFVSPSMDHLAPVVSFTRRHDAMVLNGQCPELADGWDLGPWWLTTEGGVIRPRSNTEERQIASSRHHSRDALDNSWGWVGTEETDGPTGEPGYVESMFPSLSRMMSVGRIYSGDDKNDDGEDEPKSPLSPSKSFPSIKYLLPGGNAPLAPPIAGSNEKQQDTVMGNIKNLFYSQSPGSLSAVPPDQNMMRKAKGQSRDSLMDDGGADAITRQVLGVYTTAHPSQATMSSVALEQLDRTVSICVLNATVCTELGQMGKADTWSLLAQVVDDLSKSIYDGFDGWGGALGRELVANILRFYEVQGDVQMLATIVCVLSGGRDRRMGNRLLTFPEQGGKSGLQNLLPDDDRLLDAYIIRYSMLLYAWGKLTTRTELSKHLAYVFPGAGGEQLIPFERPSTGEEGKEHQTAFDGKKLFIPNEGPPSGITFAPLCPRCLKPAQSDTNVCASCKDYAFRCAICTNAVRGLFTVCLTCGHGGHVEHMLPWFEKFRTCPTGCGCSCILSTYTSEKGAGGVGSKTFQGAIIDGGGGQSVRRSIISGAAAMAQQQRRPTPATGAGMELGSGLGSVPFGAYISQRSAAEGSPRNWQYRRKSSLH